MPVSSSCPADTVTAGYQQAHPIHYGGHRVATFSRLAIGKDFFPKQLLLLLLLLLLLCFWEVAFERPWHGSCLYLYLVYCHIIMSHGMEPRDQIEDLNSFIPFVYSSLFKIPGPRARAACVYIYLVAVISSTSVTGHQARTFVAT